LEHDPPTAKATPKRDTTSRVIGRTIATRRPTMLRLSPKCGRAHSWS
jgi:hypothetical protein